MAEQPAQRGLPRKPKRILAAVAAGIVAVGVAYGIGRIHSCSQVERAEQTAQLAASASQSATSELETKLAQAQRRGDQLESRRQLHLALLAMDSRNFGIAQSHIQSAGKLLQKGGAKEGSELADLQARIEGLNLVATEDFASQRQKLLKIIERFDELVSPEKR